MSFPWFHRLWIQNDFGCQIWKLHNLDENKLYAFYSLASEVHYQFWLSFLSKVASCCKTPCSVEITKWPLVAILENFFLIHTESFIIFPLNSWLFGFMSCYLTLYRLPVIKYGQTIDSVICNCPLITKELLRSCLLTWLSKYVNSTIVQVHIY